MNHAPGPVIFDFDGVLIESELEGNRHLAELITALGRPTTLAEAIREFTGLSGSNFFAALEAWLGGPIPDRYHEERRAEDARVLREGVPTVPGALEFVAALPGDRRTAIVSSSSTDWLRTHLAHLDLEGRFEPHLYSGKEHVERGKPAPDVYLHAAAALHADPATCFVIEDSPPGVTAAAAAGMHVCGLLAGGHVLDGHAEALTAAGASVLAKDYEEVAAHLAAFDGRSE